MAEIPEELQGFGRVKPLQPWQYHTCYSFGCCNVVKWKVWDYEEKQWVGYCEVCQDPQE